MPDSFPVRRNPRLTEHDYAGHSTYFVTLCSHGKHDIFGEARGGQVLLSRLGQIVEGQWRRVAGVRPCVQLGAFVVMPNHFHAIVALAGDRQAQQASDIQQPELLRVPHGVAPPTLGHVIRDFKAACTREARDVLHDSGAVIWQRNYYEHIIRDEDDLARIHDYIADNPANWATDEENTNRTPREAQ